MLGLHSDYAGGNKDFLSWSLLGLLMKEGKLKRKNIAEVITKLKSGSSYSDSRPFGAHQVKPHRVMRADQQATVLGTNLGTDVSASRDI